MRNVLVLIKNSRETSQMLEMKHVYVLFFHEFILMLKPATQIKDGTDYFTRILWCLCLRKELPSFYCCILFTIPQMFVVRTAVGFI